MDIFSKFEDTSENFFFFLLADIFRKTNYSLNTVTNFIISGKFIITNSKIVQILPRDFKKTILPSKSSIIST